MRRKGPREFVELLRAHPSMRAYNVTGEKVQRVLQSLIAKEPRFRMLEGLDLEHVGQQLINEALHELVEPLSKEQRDAVLEGVAAAEIRLGDANAFSAVPQDFASLFGEKVHEYEGFVIGLHDGLSSLMQDVATVLISSLTIVSTRRVDNPQQDPQTIEMDPLLPFDEGARRIVAVVEGSLGPTAGRETKVPIFTDKRRWLAGKASIAAHRFILAHELSHILLGHVGSPGPALVTPNYELPEFSAPAEHRLELEADHHALCLMWDRAVGEEDEAGLASLVLGVEFALFVLRMRERIGGLEGTRSHPSAGERLRLLRENIQLPSHHYELSNAVVPMLEKAMESCGFGSTPG